MTEKKKGSKRWNPVYFAIIAFIIFSIICFAFIKVVYDSMKQKETLNIIERYMIFESKVERLIYSNVALL